MTEAARLEAALRDLKPVTPDVIAEPHRPDQPPADGAHAGRRRPVRARPSRSARSLGLDLGEGSTGGGSDGNFTAALGIPTLDGLGCPGAGAHADDEHILIDGLLERAALLGALLLEL